MNKAAQQNTSSILTPHQSTILDCYRDDIDISHKAKNILRSRVVIVGDSCVGKTTLLRSAFPKPGATSVKKEYTMTLGIEFHVESVELLEDKNTTVDLFLYALGGSDISAADTSLYDSVDYIVCVYNVNNDASFLHHQDWIQRVREANGALRGHKIHCLLVANKIDLLHDIQAENVSTNPNIFIKKKYSTPSTSNKKRLIYIKRMGCIYSKKEEPWRREMDVHSLSVQPYKV